MCLNRASFVSSSTQSSISYTRWRWYLTSDVASSVPSYVGCLSDPGAVPSTAACLPDAVEEERLSYCVKCNAFKPPRAHHCSQCNRCIVRMDHHCPWVNNCIGFRNMKYFVLFLVYVVLMCFYTFSLDCCRLYYTYMHVTEESTSGRGDERRFTPSDYRYDDNDEFVVSLCRICGLDAV